MTKSKPMTESKPSFVECLERLDACIGALDWIEKKGFKTIREAYDGLDELPPSQAIAWFWWLVEHLTDKDVGNSAFVVWGDYPDLDEGFTQPMTLQQLKDAVPVPTLNDLKQGVRRMEWLFSEEVDDGPEYPWESVKHE